MNSVILFFSLLQNFAQNFSELDFSFFFFVSMHSFFNFAVSCYLFSSFGFT